jgi:hypothetical protein
VSEHQPVLPPHAGGGLALPVRGVRVPSEASSTTAAWSRVRPSTADRPASSGQVAQQHDAALYLVAGLGAGHRPVQDGPDRAVLLPDQSNKPSVTGAP